MANQYAYSIRQALLAGVRQSAAVRIEESTLEDCTGLTPDKDALVLRAMSALPFASTTVPRAKMKFMDGEELYVLSETSGGAVTLNVINRTAWTLSSDLFTAGAALSMVSGAGSISPSGSGTGVQWVGHSNQILGSTGDFLFTNFSLYSGLACGRKADVWVPAALGLYGDRLVMGGLSTTKNISAGSAWLTSWELLKKYSYDTELTQTADTIDESMLIIGMPGGGASDEPYSFELCLLTEYKAADYIPMLHNAIRNREIILSRVPWGGKVLGVQAYLSGMLVYTDRGVGRMEVTESGPKYLQLSGAPVAGRNCFDGDSKQACFVAKDGRAYVADGEYSFTEYNFREHLTARIAVSGFTVRLDRRLGEFYFLSPEHKAAKLSKERKFSFDNGIFTSLFYYNDKTYGNFETQVLTFTVKIRLSDRNRRMLKQFQHFELFYSEVDDLQAKLEYRYSEKETFKTSASFTPNKESVVYFGRQYTEANIILTGTATTSSAIWDGTVRYQNTDRRYDRGIGPNANTIGGQPDA